MRDGVKTGAKSGVMSSVPDGAVMTGVPLLPRMKQLRSQAVYIRLPELEQRLREVEKLLKDKE